MKKANYIVLDTETGGVNHEENPITQIALIAVDGVTFEELARDEFYIKPYDDLVILKKALQVTGLKMSDINDGLEKKKAVERITKFAKSNSPNSRAENRPIIVAHNAIFDVNMLNSLFERCNKSLWNVFSDNTQCTMLLSKMFDPSTSSLKLGVCCEKLGIELNDAHRAMNDTVATKDLFISYLRKLSNKKIKVNAPDSKQSKTKNNRTTFQF